jgi:polysaccharide deacetylase family protein (PEP-CTERM system associated)
MVLNVLSVDVEEYFHAAIFRKATANSGHRFESRLQRSMDRLLGLLAPRGITATFFVLGEVAVTHPEVVRRIAAEGHEVACHGDRHEDVKAQTPREFRADIHRAKCRLEDVFGGPVVGYRAPNFSIGGEQSWAYEILHSEGFRYDSSTHPIVHDRYGAPGAARFPHEIWRDGAARLVEFPIGTARLLGVNLPIGGGGYFRLLPFALVRMGIEHVNSREQRPVMFYLHPWELDPEQPRPPMAWRYRFRHYVGMEREEAKLLALLDRFRFGTARDVLALEGIRLDAVAPAAAPQAVAAC